MALELSYDDATGTVHPKAYMRVQKIIIENPVNGPKNVSLDVCIYASQAARDAGKSPVWGPQGFQVQKEAAVQPEEKDAPVVMECGVDAEKATIADAYVWLKTQAAYKTAKDV